MLYSFLKPLLFKLDAERSHDLTLKLLSAISDFPGILNVLGFSLQNPDHDKVSVMGLEFVNRVGLAAGLDKNGIAIKAFAAMGFGFVEVGTVTPRPQIGNPKPRLFRYVNQNAIVNRMGFNNLGVDALVETLKKTGSIHPIKLGINIGKNKDTSNEDAYLDYLSCLTKVYPYADYITVNISSPNTPGLRQLQHQADLEKLLLPLKVEQSRLMSVYGKKVPLVVKIAPDLTEAEIPLMAQTFVNLNIDGIIATNTTLNHESIQNEQEGDEAGGLSGQPLMNASTQVIRMLSKALDGKIPIIGVGGIFNAKDAQSKIEAGSELVQLYTGLLYKGPTLIHEVVSALSKKS